MFKPEFWQKFVAGDDDSNSGFVESVNDGIVAEIRVN